MSSPQDPNNPPGYGSNQQPPQYGNQPDYGYGSQQPPPPGYGGGTPPGSPGYPGSYEASPRELPKGLAIAALVLGIVALLSSWTAVGGVIFGIVAIVLGIIGMRKANRYEAGGKSMAVTGLVLGILSLLIGAVVAVIVVFAVNMFGDAVQECRQFQDDPQRFQECLMEQGPQSLDIGTEGHVLIRK